MVLCLLAIVYNGHNDYILSYKFRNGLIDYFEVFVQGSRKPNWIGAATKPHPLIT